MRTVDRILAWILVLGGVLHGVGSSLGYKHEPLTLLWALSASLFNLETAAINLFASATALGSAPCVDSLCGSLALAASAFTFGRTDRQCIRLARAGEWICGTGASGLQFEDGAGSCERKGLTEIDRWSLTQGTKPPPQARRWLPSPRAECADQAKRPASHWRRRALLPQAPIRPLDRWRSPIWASSSEAAKWLIQSVAQSGGALLLGQHDTRSLRRCTHAHGQGDWIVDQRNV